MTKPRLILSLAVAGLAAGLHAQPVLFSDDFDTDTSANWSVFDGSNTGPSDFNVQFNFNYGAVKYTFETTPGVFVTNTIPPAPNSVGGTTKGVRLAVNKNDDTADQAGVSLYPKGQSFSGNYALRADLWINYNGGSYGGVGSTEFATMGINHTGNTVNWWDLVPTGDGSWFAVAGEAGAARDYRAYEFDGTQSVELRGADGGLIGADHGEVPFQERFPAPWYESPGAPGKRWTQLEVAQRDGQLIWKLDGFVIAERANTSPFNAGTIMIGTMDVFASIADPKIENYVIFDNVHVVNLDAEPAPSTVKVEVTDGTAAEPADNGVFTIRRVGGDQSKPLEVTYRLSGTATAGVDYETNSLSGFRVVIPAGADSTTVTIQPINDTKGETTETVILTLTGNPNYEMRDSISGGLELLDDGDTALVTITATDAYSYERIPEDTATFTVARSGDTSTPLTVQLDIGGTATNGTDYETVANTVAFGPGDEKVTVTIVPKDDPLVEGDETVVVTVKPGAGYSIGPDASATATILDNDYPDALVLFSDNLDSTDSSKWQLRFSAANGLDDYRAQFGYDYSADSIPPAPSSNGTTRGLKVTVNKDEPSANGAAALNVYLKNANFSGDFAVRFDMFLTFNTSAAGTTEHAIFGLDHSGALTNRHGFAGGDGIWFAVETDGSASSGRSYVNFQGLPNAVPTFTAKPASAFANYFTSPPYLAAGAASGVWVDVEMRQVGGKVSLKMNGAPIFDNVGAGTPPSGTIMLGHMDTFSSVGAAENYTLFDNVRVVELQPVIVLQPVIKSIAVTGGNTIITFTSESGSVETLVVEGAATVNGPYATEAATITSAPGLDTFQAVLPATGATHFYRLRR